MQASAIVSLTTWRLWRHRLRRFTRFKNYVKMDLVLDVMMPMPVKKRRVSKAVEFVIRSSLWFTCNQIGKCRHQLQVETQTPELLPCKCCTFQMNQAELHGILITCFSWIAVSINRKEKVTSAVWLVKEHRHQCR